MYEITMPMYSHSTPKIPHIYSVYHWFLLLWHRERLSYWLNKAYHSYLIGYRCGEEQLMADLLSAVCLIAVELEALYGCLW
jgi:hypothetical protein